MDKDQKLQQPKTVRFVIFVNVLMWSAALPLPMIGGSSFNMTLLLTFLSCFFVRSRSENKISKVLIFGAFILVYSFIVFFIGPCQSGIVRLFVSSTLLALLLLALNRISTIVKQNIPIISLYDTRLIIILVLVFNFAEVIMGIRSGNFGIGSRIGGIYSEPSHLALSVSPLIYYLWKTGTRNDKMFIGCAMIIILVLSSSSTFLFLLFLLFFLEYGIRMYRSGNKLPMVFGLFTISAIVAVFFLTPFSAHTLVRIRGILSLTEDSNISSLVYVNGWQMLFANLQATHWLGLGFNSMGCDPRTITPAMEFLDLSNLGHLNYNDGSFLLSKLGSELGIVGILIWSFLIYFTFLFLNQRERKINAETLILYYAWMLIVSFGGIIRSAGYFTGPVILCLFIIINYYKSKRSLKEDI